nr:PQQ-like beta-propeller repeat protein [PVC group bacterium]
RRHQMAALLLTVLCRVSAAAPAPGALAQARTPKRFDRLPVVTMHPTAVTAWKVALLDVDQDGKEEILCTGYDGDLICQDVARNEMLWRKSVEGFPFCLVLADLTNDGVPEILVSSSSLHVYAFATSGRLLWTFESPFPVLSVAVVHTASPCVVAVGNGPIGFLIGANGAARGRFPISDRLSTVAVLAGDIAGNAAQDVLVMNQYGRYTVQDLSGRTPHWSGGKHSRAARFGKAVALWDIDEDDKVEVLSVRCRRVFNGRRNMMTYFLDARVEDNDGSLVWERSVPLPGGAEYTYVDAFAVAADCTGDGCAEAVISLGPVLCVIGRNGDVLYCRRCLRDMAFTHLSLSPATGQLVLGSVVGASDKSVYRLRFAESAEQATDEFAALTPYHGNYQKIRANLREIHRAVLAAPAQATPQRRGRVTISGRGTIASNRLQELFPYENVRFISVYGGGAPPETVAANFVSSGISHSALVSHGLKRGNRATHWPSLPQLADYFRRTGPLCLSIGFAETSAFMMPSQDDRSVPYLNEFMLPCMDLAIQNGKDICLWEKQAWWAAVCARSKFREIFAPRFWPYLIARTEESNSRCPELNLMARVGLYRAGIVREWGCNVIRDLWRTLSTFILEYDYNDPSAVLRQLVAYVAAGATDIRLQYDFGAKDENGVYHLSADRDLDLVLETFLHLLGKGLLVPPAPDEIEGLSPVVLRLHEPHCGLLRNTDGNVEDFKPDPEARRGLLTGYWWWALCRTHPAYFSSYILNVRNYGHDFIPETPYGLPVVVPHWTPAEKLSWATEIIDTDGVFVLEDGRKRTAAESKEKILHLFEKRAEKLAVRASAGYCMARRRAADELRVVVVDHGVFSPEPRDRTVTVHVADGLQIDRATDVLTGQPFTVAAPDRLAVAVPAGAFRIIDVRIKR